jgi:HK97 family phage major capsid protein
VRSALETEILSGDGTGEHFTGILNTSGVVVQPFVTSTLISIRHALATLDAQGYAPSAIVTSTNDWRDLEPLLATSGATDVRGIPLDSLSRRVWGTPVVLSNGLPAKTALVIGAGAAVVDSDGQFGVKWFDSINDDPVKNQVRLRVEPGPV